MMTLANTHLIIWWENLQFLGTTVIVPQNINKCHSHNNIFHAKSIQNLIYNRIKQ
jgi:hypothetical protein